MIPLYVPDVPRNFVYRKYLDLVDKNYKYSNFGPLNDILEKNIADLVNLKQSNVATVSNATCGLIATINSVKTKGRRICILPSWTFVATAAAVLNAGLEPFFVDVDIETWGADLGCLQEVINRYQNDIAAIIVVSPFGSKLDLDSYHKLSEKNNIPIVIDAAASFDTYIMSNNGFSYSMPMVFSMHATKIFGIGEGGIVLSNNDSLIKDIRSRINFGLTQSKSGERDAATCGFNGKLSEFHAAIALGQLDRWSNMAKKMRGIKNYYLKKLNQLSIKYFYPANSLSSTLNIIVNNADEMIEFLLTNNIACKKWWDNGCHRMSYYKNFNCTHLKNTNTLAKKVLGVPFHTQLKKDDVDYIVNKINDFLN